MNAPAIHIKNVSLSYQNVSVFSNVNFSLRAGKWTALLGTSGVGKSSLLRLIAGLNTAEERVSGSIVADNQVATPHQAAWMAQTDMLLPWLTVRENLLLGDKLRGKTLSFVQCMMKRWMPQFLLKALNPAPGAARDDMCKMQDEATSLLLKSNLAHAENFYPHQLSGGMRQRVALLRTLIENKPVVLMDEPFSALDTITRHQLHQLAVELLRDKTVLFVTHDPLEALQLADEVYLLTTTGIQHVASLHSAAPRTISDPEVIEQQKFIFAELLQQESAA